MTIALAAKVPDGLVLAADSATTQPIYVPNCDLFHAAHVFNNGEKITNLSRSLPIGMMTWGVGALSTHSINWHGKELRRRFEGNDRDLPEWRIDPANFSVLEIATKVHEYFSAFSEFQAVPAPGFGLLIAGYSSDGTEPQAFTIENTASGLSQPDAKLTEIAEILFFGQPEAIERLTLGYSGQLGAALLSMGAAANDLPQILEVIKNQTRNPLIHRSMPIQDVLDLADYLVDATIKYVRFSSGPNTVGGSIDLAAITRHEGFKWVNRKHYYPSEFNPRETQ